MSCCMEIKENHIAPFFTGTKRLLLGFILLAAGIYVAAQSGIQGHGLGYLMILASPFLFVEDDK